MLCCVSEIEMDLGTNRPYCVCSNYKDDEDDEGEEDDDDDDDEEEEEEEVKMIMKLGFRDQLFFF